VARWSGRSQKPRAGGQVAAAFRQLRLLIAFLARMGGCGRVGSDAWDVQDPGMDLNREQDMDTLEEDGSTYRKSWARMPDARAAGNCRQVGDVRRGAGQSPTAAGIRRIAPARPLPRTVRDVYVTRVRHYPHHTEKISQSHSLKY
jgi:hypothetical protein